MGDVGMGAQESCAQAAVPASGAWLSHLTTGDWFSVIAAIVTAVGVLWAIFQHFQAQRLSAKLAVLEHRRKIYDQLREVLLELNSCGDIVHPVWVSADKLWINSAHLFDSDVRDYLKSIRDKIGHLETVRNELFRATTPEERDRLVAQQSSLWSWLTAQHENRSHVFEKYLRLP